VQASSVAMTDAAVCAVRASKVRTATSLSSASSLLLSAHPRVRTRSAEAMAAAGSAVSATSARTALPERA
jgi:hypothetical protein